MRSTLLGLSAAALLIASPVMAQTAITETAVAVAQSDAMASNLVGLDVRNANNDDVGEIEDLVLDANMTVKGLVVSVGGFLGVGERYVVVPPKAVTVTFDAGAKEWKAMTGLTKDQLTAMPEFKYEGKFDD